MFDNKSHRSNNNLSAVLVKIWQYYTSIHFSSRSLQIVMNVLSYLTIFVFFLSQTAKTAMHGCQITKQDTLHVIDILSIWLSHQRAPQWTRCLRDILQEPLLSYLHVNDLSLECIHWHSIMILRPNLQRIYYDYWAITFIALTVQPTAATPVIDRVPYYMLLLQSNLWHNGVCSNISTFGKNTH
jgi:hypothetical protein